MGITKSDLFTEEQNQLAAMAKLFSHPARIAILQEVIKSKSCINHLLVQELGLAQATISQHLKELKSAGILCGSVEGNSISYCINTSVWNTLQAQFIQFFSLYTETNTTTASSSCSC